jgi:hypothetical protein
MFFLIISPCILLDYLLASAFGLARYTLPCYLLFAYRSSPTGGPTGFYVMILFFFVICHDQKYQIDGLQSNLRF